jgi:predicted small lipoprotein YifL
MQQREASVVGPAGTAARMAIAAATFAMLTACGLKGSLVASAPASSAAASSPAASAAYQ